MPFTVIQTLPESYVVAPASCPPVSVDPELLLEKEALLKSLESYVEEEDRE